MAYAESSAHASQNSLVRALLRHDPHRNSIYVADRFYGVYPIAHVARAYEQPVVLRLTAQRAQALKKQARAPQHTPAGQAWALSWQPTAHATVEADLPTTPIAGRLLYTHLQRDGFRPLPLYLFTTLLDRKQYTLSALVELYGLRWQVEVGYRHLKTTLQMEQFEVHSAAMFRKELAAGLLAYNLICACMVSAAERANVPANQLSFSRCLRRIRTILQEGVPAWVLLLQDLQAWFLARLARCRLPHQPNKVRHEPRAIRRQPVVYPALKGDRARARQQLLEKLAA